MELHKILGERRTIRVFQQLAVSDEQLKALIDAARRASSAGNLQRLRYVIVRTPEMVKQVLAQTAWAAYVTPKRTPEWGKTAPAAFIVVTGPAKDAGALHLYADAGAAIQTIEYAAWDAGLGCCWMGAIQKDPIHALLKLSKEESILYVVAVGYPAESPVSYDIGKGESVKYTLDAQNRIHVPKFSVDALATWR